MVRPFYKPSITQDLDDIPDDAPQEKKGEVRAGKGIESYKLAAFWKQQIEAYEQFNSRWFTRGNMILKRYRDERASTGGVEGSSRRYNILYTNVSILKPAIYSRMPDPIVDRRFLQKDVVGRLSSVILERTIIAQLEYDYHVSMNQAVYDRLLPGRGQVWLRYDNELEEIVDKNASIATQPSNGLEDSIARIAKEVDDPDLIAETSKDEALEDSGSALLIEKVVTDYINWRDFYTFPTRARTWSEVQAVAKRLYMSKQECIERFGEEIGSQMQADTMPETSDNKRASVSDTSIFRDTNERSIVVWEIWNKSDRRIYWVSSGYMYLCDVRPDLYKLKGFFPCPRPLSATLTTDSLTPVPDYIQYQDQAIQLDELTQRIAMLTKACKVAGVYNAAQKALSRIFQETSENQLIPVDQWAMFAEAGGVKGAMDFVPLDQIKATIDTLTTVRQQCKQDLDEITGISDVVRGTTDSRETLGGLRLKNNNAGTRLTESQEEVQRFARDAIALIGEIAAKHFEVETLVEASGILYDDEMQPDSVLREYEPNLPGFMNTKNDKPPQQSVSTPNAGAGPSPHSVPPINTPMQNAGAAQPQQQPGNGNIVQFPGASQGMQGMGAMPMQSPMLDPDALIMDKLEKAIKLLRSDVPRKYRIAIETDSTIFGDKVQERQDASDFVEAMGGYMANFERLGQEVPEAMPLLARSLQWAVRKFRIGRDLEAEINSFVARMEKKAKKLIENPQPSIEQQKLQADKEGRQMEIQAKMQIQQMQGEQQERDDIRQAQIQAQNDQRDAEKARLEDERTAQLAEMDLQIKREELEFKRQENQMKLQMMQAQLEIEIQKMHMKAQSEQQSANTDAMAREHEHSLNMEASEKQHSQNIEQSNTQHAHKMRESEVAAKATEQKAELGEASYNQKKDLSEQQHKQKMQAAKQKPKPKGEK